jgi:hypothetical protein
MHERTYEAEEYRITIYTTSRNYELLTVDKCVELISSVPIRLPRGFVVREDRIFTKAAILHSRSYLKAMRIDRIRSSRGSHRILKELLPGVFDLRYIRAVNWQRHLYENRELICRAATKILGAGEAAVLRERISWEHRDCVEEDDFEILDMEMLEF